MFHQTFGLVNMSIHTELHAEKQSFFFLFILHFRILEHQGR